MLRRLVLVFVLLACSFAASAAKGPGAVRKQVESSLLVTGTIDITPAGEVIAHTLDQPEKLPKGIVNMAARMLPQWKFEPVALQKNAVSRSTMNLLFVGKQLHDGNYSVELRSATFGGSNPEEIVRIDYKKRPLPAYPQDLLNAGITGTVFLILKIGRDGSVVNAEASHVNLRVIGSESRMTAWRKTLARNSIVAVKRWTFLPPTSGPDAGKDYWLGTLPMDYIIYGRKEANYGEWKTYVAGPKTLIPWQDQTILASGNNDALTPNGFQTAGTGRRLLTPLPDG